MFRTVNKVRVRTGVGMFTKEYRLPNGGMPMGDYLSNDFWEDVDFSSRITSTEWKTEKSIMYSISSYPDYLKSNKGWGFIQNDDGSLLLFVIYGFVSIKIKNLDFVQAICVEIPTTSFLSLVDTLCVRYLKVEDIRAPNKNRMFLLPINRYYNKQGIILNVDQKQHLFLSMSTFIQQCKEIDPTNEL